MTDAPEKIWAIGFPTDKGRLDWSEGSFDQVYDGDGDAEYIRADIHEAVVAQNKLLREALEEIAKDTLGDGWRIVWRDVVADKTATARAALEGEG